MQCWSRMSFSTDMSSRCCQPFPLGFLGAGAAGLVCFWGRLCCQALLRSASALCSPVPQEHKGLAYSSLWGRECGAGPPKAWHACAWQSWTDQCQTAWGWAVQVLLFHRVSLFGLAWFRLKKHNFSGRCEKIFRSEDTLWEVTLNGFEKKKWTPVPPSCP